MSPPAARGATRRIAFALGLLVATAAALGGPPGAVADTSVAALAPAAAVAVADGVVPPAPAPSEPSEVSPSPAPAQPTADPTADPAEEPTQEPPEGTDPPTEQPQPTAEAPSAPAPLEDPASLLGGPASTTAATGPTAGVALLGASTASFDTLTVEVAEVAGVKVLQVVTGAGLFRDLGLTTGCAPLGPASPLGMQHRTTTADGAAATVADGMTLYAASFTFTTPLGATTWSPETPPPVSEFADVVLTDLAVDMVRVELPSLDARGLAQQTSFCTA